MKKIFLTAAIILSASFVICAQSERQRLDSLVQSYVEQADFTGTVLVANRNGIIHNKGYGYRDAEIKAPNEPNTIYNIASLTKTFTAALVLKLQEQGKLSVHDALHKYIPSYPKGEQITIHQLLTHTSGIFNYTEDRRFSSIDQSKIVSIDTMLSFFQNKSLDFIPGTKFHYSNSGYTLLGLIIEKVTGLPYGKALSKFIFEPLGMKQTSYGPPATSPSLSKGYGFYFKNFQQRVAMVHPSVSYATGAVYSTVEDLYKWNLALQHSFLSQASLRAAYTKDKGNYGYGWFTDSLYGQLRVSHDGNIAGYKSNINRMPGDSICIIALSNANNSSVGRMVRDLLNILYHQPLSIPFAAQPVIAMTDSAKMLYVGKYRYGNDTLAKIEVKLQGSELVLQIPGLVPFLIQPVNRNQFKAGHRRIEFQNNQQGQVVQIIVYDNGEVVGGSKE